MRKHIALMLGLLPLLSPTLAAADNASEVQEVAKKYLGALSGDGDDSGREQLLGGVTMTAQIASLDNWKIVSKDPVRQETGDLARARQAMRELDASGEVTQKKLLDAAGGGDELTMTELTASQAAKLLAPTEAKAQKFQKISPVLAYVARVGKEVYWHPLNPIRKVMVQAGDSGPYEVEVHRLLIETRAGPSQTTRKWPLKIMRLKTKRMDTGWKVLPASDWSPE